MQLVSYMPVMDIEHEIGRRLREMRIENRMTQKELCEATGVPISTLSRIENGEIKSFDSFLMLLKAFGQIEKIELVLPERQLRPSDLIKNQKQVKRVRKSKEHDGQTPWKWGDEE